jgi:hypothetical protein
MGRIPFDTGFTKAMVRGKTIFEENGHSKGAEAVKRIWGDLARSLEL